MKINKVALKNFRCFSDLNIDLHQSLTVIVAENGQGKTAILDAIRVGLGQFLCAIDLSKGSGGHLPEITVSDIRIIRKGKQMARQLPCKISFNGNWGDGDKEWFFRRSSEDATNENDYGDGNKTLWRYADMLQNESRKLDKMPPVEFPVLAFYGTNRNWSSQKLANVNVLHEQIVNMHIRTYGYRDCMNPAANYINFKDWFVHITEVYFEEMAKSSFEKNVFSNLQSGLDSQKTIELIQAATDTFLKEITGWHTLEYSVAQGKELVLNHDINGSIPVNLLSDGIRSVLAMIGDIAYRCYQLNPHFGVDAALKTKGIILIDEIDMHLHPKWQQVVAAQLREAFPNIQFVVTTHSPQVLTTVPRECIRQLNADGSVTIPESQSRGSDSGTVLSTIMGTDPLPSNVPEVIDLKRYTSLIEQGIFTTDEVKKLRKKLYSHFSKSDFRLYRSERIAKLNFPDKYTLGDGNA